MSSRMIERVLVIEDHERLRDSLYRVLGEQYTFVECVGTVAEAREALRKQPRPDLVILDYDLPDGNGRDIMEIVSQGDAFPLVIAMSGAAKPDQAFGLAQLGVRTFLSKPLDLDRLNEAIEHARANPPDLRPQLRQLVEQRAIREVEEEVRSSMLDEALARSGGSRRGAARLLQVSRQLVQHMIRKRKD